MSVLTLKVDEVMRTLSAESSNPFVTHDKEVDIVRFAINSGFADIVLDGQVALRVMYQRPGETEVRAQTLTYYDTDGLHNYYDWQLAQSDLTKDGSLMVALCILDISGGEVSEWHTTPCAVRVLPTIHTDDSDEGDAEVTPTVKERVAVLESMIQRVASGAPIVVSSASAMTDTAQIYVLSTDGMWYYYDGSAWVAGGEYGAVATDTTLSQSGVPADAKTVGDAIVNGVDNGTLFSSIMGYGKTEISSKRYFTLYKNHVIIDTTGTSSAYRGCNLFGDPHIFSCTSANLIETVSQLTVHPISIPDGYDLILFVEFDHVNTSNLTYISAITSDLDGNVTYNRLVTDSSERIKIVNISEQMPEVLNNQNLALATINRHTDSANNFIYRLVISKKDEDYDGRLTKVENYINNGALYNEIGIGTTDKVYGCTFETEKNSAKAVCEIPSSGTTAYRGCALIGNPTNFATVSGGSWDFSTQNFYSLDFDLNSFDLYMSIMWDNVYANAHNYLYVATKNSTDDTIKWAVIFRDQSARKDYINLFSLLPEIRKNKNIQIVFENRDRTYPNSFTYFFSLLEKSVFDVIESGEVGLPQYYVTDDYMTERMHAILGNIDATENIFTTDTFIWITDLHIWTNDVTTQRNGLQSAKLIRYLINNIRIPLVFCGGDLLNGNTMSKSKATELLMCANRYLSMISDKSYMIIGNHEWNNPGNLESQISNELHTSLLYNMFVRDKESNYISVSPKMDYCFDNKIQKIRYFCISCTKQGNIWWHTAVWLAEQMLVVPDGYTVVILSHIALDSESNISSYFKIITDILDAANSHESYTYRDITYDYGNFSATISCIISGHVHYDGNTVTSTGIPVIATTCDRGTVSEIPSAESTIRKIGTIGEQAFDVVQIDTDSRKIYLTRIGGSTLGAVYDPNTGKVVDAADYDSDTGTISPTAVRYDADEWVRYSPYKDRVFEY